MLMLLLWLNQKIVKLYNQLQARKQQKMIRRQAVEMHLYSRNLPEYLKKDLGLPPYDSIRNKYDL